MTNENELKDVTPKTEGAKKESRLSNLNLTQQLDIDMWAEGSAEVLASVNELLDSGDKIEATRLIANHVKELIDTKSNSRVGAVYAIIHDKDVKEVWDETVSDMVIVPKARHVHMVLRFTNKKGVGIKLPTLKEVSTAVGLGTERLEKLRSGRYGLPNSLSYLIHAKEEGKYRYPVSDVVTIRGNEYDKADNYPLYQTIEHEYRQSWKNGRAKKKLDELEKVSADALFEMVLDGKITKSQMIMDNDYYRIYAMNKAKYDTAFEALMERKYHEAIASIQRGEFNLKVLFIHGKSGSGKTRLARDITNRALEEAKSNGENWGIYETSAINPFDGYRGEEILLMDDLRGESLVPTEWLRLFDPENPNVMGARYKNKPVTSRLIVLTSIQDVHEFFAASRSNVKSNEPADQFIRRLLGSIEVVEAGDSRYYLMTNYGKKKYSGEYGGIQKRAMVSAEDVYKAVNDYDYQTGLDYDDVVSEIGYLKNENEELRLAEIAGKDLRGDVYEFEDQ